MPVFFAFVVLTAGVGVGLLMMMFVRSSPYLGVLGLITLCLSGIAGAAYGVIDSAP